MIAALTLAAAVSFGPSHAAWTAQLGRFVQDGAVDYRGWKAAEGELDGYLRQLLAVRKEQFAGFSKAGQLAFLINAYNAYTVRLILDHYPLSSIRAIGLLPGAAFRRSFIPLFGEELSLNDLEGKLRALGEPRIHFAIVCASKSCPRLRSEAYRAQDLDAQLADAARQFLADPGKNRFEPGAMHLSKIFDWYRDDFAAAAGSVPAYVAKVAARALSGGERIDYLDYDWSLNGR